MYYRFQNGYYGSGQPAGKAWNAVDGLKKGIFSIRINKRMRLGRGVFQSGHSENDHTAGIQ